MVDEQILIENSVLGTIILQPQYQDYIEKIDEIDIKEPQNKKLLRLLKHLKENNRPIDLVSVSEEFKDAVYITGVTQSYITTDTFEDHFKEIKNRGIRRKLFLAAKKIAQMVEKTEDGLTAKNNALQIISDIPANDIEEEDDSMKAVLLETMAYIEKKHNAKKEELYLTPFTDLNSLTGGLDEQEFILIAARPALGKTAIALQISNYMAKRGKHTLFVSLEMSKHQLGLRIFAGETNINSWHMKTGKLTDSDWATLVKVAGPLSDNKMRVNTKMATIQDIRAYCRELKRKNMLDMVVIDYLQLIRPSGKHGTREQEVASMSRELKLMSREFKIPVIAISQLNRAADNRRPGLPDLRESGALEQDADTVWFLYEPPPDDIPKKYMQAALDIRNRGEKFMELIVAKQRNGDVGTIYLAYEGARTRFKNIELWREEDGVGRQKQK